jgi:3-deoxy-manno-octulosonate cytidylyltransferase (CMP-KDO synthetase)
MKSLAVIPARFASTRFPGKPLADLGGRPMIQHVYERTARARGLDAVVVATDDARIYDAVRAFGGVAAMTSSAHRTGTDRVAEVARAREYADAELVLNIQGDEPFVDSQSIEALLGALRAPGGPRFATLCERLDESDRARPNVVKVVTSLAGEALYFSRAALSGPAHRHVGFYGFRRDALFWFAATAPTPLELAESLEQLRILEHGERMAVALSAGHTLAIDTPEDLERARARLAREGGGELAA